MEFYRAMNTNGKGLFYVSGAAGASNKYDGTTRLQISSLAKQGFQPGQDLSLPG